MKTNRRFSLFSVLFLAGLMTGFHAEAAGLPAFEGKFTLMAETNWAQATLPAGQYTFTLDHKYAGGVVTVMQGDKCVARILTAGINSISSGPSEIVAEGGTVREVKLPTIGVSLHYLAAKSRRRAAPRAPQMAQITPVSATSAGR